MGFKYTHLKLTTQKSPGPSGTLMALLRMQFGMEGQESTSSTQEAKKTKLASLPAYTPQTTKLKQKPWKQQQLILKPALMLPPMLSSLRMPCPSCRPSSQIGTLNSMTCLLLLPHFVDAMQSPYNGCHCTATCLAMRLLTLWQRRAQQKSKWIDPPATLRWRPSSRPSNSKWRHKHPRYNKGTSYSIQAQDRPQPPQLSPVFQTPHWPYRAVRLRYWQSDNRTSTAVLPHLRATQKGNLARPHSRSPQAVRKPEGPVMHCHLHRGDWSFHLTNEKKKKKYTHRHMHTARVSYMDISKTTVLSAGHCYVAGWWNDQQTKRHKQCIVCQTLNQFARQELPRWPSGKVSALRAANLGFDSRFAPGFFQVESYQWLKKLALQWLPWEAPGVIGSALSLVGPVSVYCDWVR